MDDRTAATTTTTTSVWSTGVRFAALVLALALALGAGSGCGIRQDDQPQRIAIDARTRDIFDKSNATAPNNAVTPATGEQVIYLVQTEGTEEVLVPVQRDVASQPGNDILARKVIEQLLMSQPDSSDQRSLIPQDTRILDATVEGEVLKLDLSRELGSVEGNGLRLAVAQIVFTATAIPGIDYVQFSIDGSPTAVPLDDETAEAGALISRSDFPKLGSTIVTTTLPAPSTVAAVPEDESNPGAAADPSDPVLDDAVESRPPTVAP